MVPAKGNSLIETDKRAVKPDRVLQDNPRLKQKAQEKLKQINHARDQLRVSVIYATHLKSPKRDRFSTEDQFLECYLDLNHARITNLAYACLQDELA